MNRMSAVAVAQPSAYADLLNPVSDTRPCGEDLEYDPAFVLLQTKVVPRASVQYGDFVATPDPLNWAEVERDCRGLLLRTRDIRLLILLIRCRCRTAQVQGLRDGLSMLQVLLAQHPDDIHPQLVIDGDRDPAMRANALAALADRSGLLSDIRELQIGNKALRLQLRDVERALALPPPEGAIAPDIVHQHLDALRAQADGPLSMIDEARAHVETILKWCEDNLPGHVPDLDPLVRLLALTSTPPQSGREPAFQSDFSEASDAPSDINDIEAPIPDIAPNTPGAPGALGDKPRNRDTVQQQIRAARQWFEQNEPSSPVTLLLRQTERLIGKPFAAVFQSIPADLVEQWSREDEE